MKVFFWNIRGLGNLDSRLLLRNLCSFYKPDIVLIAEPFVALDYISLAFWNHLNLKPFIVNDRNNLLPNIWGFCNVFLNPSILAVSRQHASFSLRWENHLVYISENHLVYISSIYACTSHTLRRDLWFELTSLQQNNPGP